MRKELRFCYIKSQVENYEIEFMCRLLNVSRQGYYNYLRSLEKPRKYELLPAEMMAIISEDECNDEYGSMRIYQALLHKKSLANCAFPHIPSERTIYRIMAKNGLIHTPKRKPNGLTKADKATQKADDLLKRDFYADEPMKKAVTGMTELPTADGKLYISAVFDCYDLMPIGFAMDDNMRAELCVKTVQSIAARYGKNAVNSMVLHSDRGSQYTSTVYKNEVKRLGILQSMNSAGGHCHDNARCESIWGRMKSELIYGRYDTKKMPMDAVKSLVWRYFMSYWCNRRICSAIGGVPPAFKRKMFYERLKVVA